VRERSEMGVSGTVSALLTVLLLVAGFAVSTGLLSAIYSAQSEVLRKAVNVGEAVSERLQAFVYEDVRTNRTLLTVRNVGSVGSEIEYLMAVGYDGSVLAEVRPGDTIKLGTQQAFTLFLSDLLGPGFDNYTEVRSRMATLYLKTVKGGVFGSGYMAPPSVMTAAYATSTTTISTAESSVTNLPIETGTETITSWNATVILDNPDHWPVEAYVGAAFADTSLLTSIDQRVVGGFPSWGFQPGLEAKKRGGAVANVTSADQIKIPRYAACGLWGYSNTIPGIHGVFQWYLGSNGPVVKPSILGPTYVGLRNLYAYYGTTVCAESPYPYGEQPPPHPDTVELFDPRGTTVRGAVFSFNPVVTYTTPWSRTATLTWTWQNVYGRTTFTETRVVYVWTWLPGWGVFDIATTWYPLATRGWFGGIDDWSNVRTQTRTWTFTYSSTYEELRRGSATTWTVTVPVTSYYIWPEYYNLLYTITKTFTVSASGRTTVYLYHTTTTTMNDVLTAVFTAPGTTWRDDSQDMQRITFPGGIYAEVRRCRDDRNSNNCPGWWYVRDSYKLAYIKVVDLWNTTNVLAFRTDANNFVVKVDRPIGIAAVYTYDRTVERLPPPPPPPPGRENYCIDKTETCESFDAGTIRRTSDIWDTAPEGQCDGQVTVTFVREGGDSNCGAWIAPGAGTYTSDQLQRCPENNGQITCTVPAGSTIINGCARPRS
jgi:hypothetical protein